jgi:hypothetical protein
MNPTSGLGLSPGTDSSLGACKAWDQQKFEIAQWEKAFAPVLDT